MNKNLSKFMGKRKKQRPSRDTSNDPYENRKIILNDLPITDKMNLEKEAYINLGRDKFKSRYYRVCFDIESEEEINQVCENYRGIKWVFHYYFKGCPFGTGNTTGDTLLLLVVFAHIYLMLT